MSDERQTQELPPRRLRHRPKRHSISPLLGTGLGLFGALFFGLVGLELYQAKDSLPAVVVEQPTESRPSLPSPADTESKIQPTAETKTLPSSRTDAQPTEKPAEKPAEKQVTDAITSPTAGDKKDSHPSPAPATTKRTVLKHVVKKGETLYQLSRKYYGNQSGVKRIAQYNGFSNEHQLKVGEVVYIPTTR